MNQTSSINDTNFISPKQNSVAPVDMAIFALLFVTSWVICIGNSITLYIITRSRNLHSTPDFFLASLAVSDLMVGVIGFMKAARLFNAFNNFLDRSKFMCLTYFGLMTLPISASCFNVVMVSLDRCLCICKPLFYRRHVDLKRAGFAIANMWIMAVAFTVTLFADNLDREMVMCVFFTVTPPWVSTIFIPAQLMCTAIIAISCYVLIFHTILKQSKKRKSMSVPQRIRGAREDMKSCSGSQVPNDVAKKNRGEDKDTRNNKKLFQTIFVVIVCYFACQLPGSIVAAMGPFYRNNIPPPVYSVVVYLAMVNSGTNFFIYIMFNPRFRRQLKFVLCNNRPCLSPPTPRTP